MKQAKDFVIARRGDIIGVDLYDDKGELIITQVFKSEEEAKSFLNDLQKALKSTEN